MNQNKNLDYYSRPFLNLNVSFMKNRILLDIILFEIRSRYLLNE